MCVRSLSLAAQGAGTSAEAWRQLLCVPGVWIWDRGRVHPDFTECFQVHYREESGFMPYDSKLKQVLNLL